MKDSLRGIKWIFSFHISSNWGQWIIQDQAVIVRNRTSVTGLFGERILGWKGSHSDLCVMFLNDRRNKWETHKWLLAYNYLPSEDAPTGLACPAVGRIAALPCVGAAERALMLRPRGARLEQNAAPFSPASAWGTPTQALANLSSFQMGSFWCQLKAISCKWAAKQEMSRAITLI